MFEKLTEGFGSVFGRLRGYGKLSERTIDEALVEIRRNLLEADVHYSVVKDWLASVRERAIGKEVGESFTPAEQFIKIVYEELISVLGKEPVELEPGSGRKTILLVGLQGSGKTTTTAKLARYLQKKGRHPYLVPIDPRRPAATEQLQVLGKKINVPVFPYDGSLKFKKVCRQALEEAEGEGADVVLVDSAGRMEIDSHLIEELQEICRAIQPQEVLLVLDGMTGQVALSVAKGFREAIGITGIVLTKMDGDARGGAALSLRATLEKPIYFMGVGEKVEELEVFYPDRLASRILGMGDLSGLMEKAQEAVSQEKARGLEEKLKSNPFTLEDFRDQLVEFRKMGPMQKLLGMLPKSLIPSMPSQPPDVEKELRGTVAIVDSMTVLERRRPKVLNGSRRRRIAKGSGTTVTDVNRLLNRFEQMQKMLNQMKKGKFQRLLQGI
ncbi:MAG: signal recognition particle protein [Deltaproteobacteria bacterium]|nr:signal recognition particle protein [Deltaproteobacteria bacterium]